MRRKTGFIFCIALLVALGAGRAALAADSNDDTDLRLVNARVVEVTDRHISVLTRTGIEHVIAVDRADTRVKRGGRYVTCAELQKDDIVTVELDEARQVKFAKQIEITRAASTEVARAPR
jgi:hypothetical protein